MKEISKELEIPVDKLAPYCRVLSEHRVVDYDPASCIVRLAPEFRRMLRELKIEDEAEWEKAGVGIVIVPPGRGFEIQGVCIHNMTDDDMQFELRFHKRLKEIVVLKA